jgi:hypothetical protein
MALTCYNREISSAKQSSWRDYYYQGIEDVPDRAVSWPTGWDLLNYLMVVHKLAKERPCRKLTGLIFKITKH